MSEMITIQEAADILEVHPGTLRRWEKNGHINTNPVRMGEHGNRKYKRAEIERIKDSWGSAEPEQS